MPGYGWRMKKIAAIIALSSLLTGQSAHAIVGGAAPSAEAISRAVVTIVGSRGNFCSGVLIAAQLVLTAAHCVQPGATYKIVAFGADEQPRLKDVSAVALHPSFDIKAIVAHRATADVALLQLAAPAEGKVAAPLGGPQPSITAGSHLTIAGIGVTIRGDGSSAGAIRTASLIATGQPGTLQIRLVDPLTQGARDGLGACTGDSGGPVYGDRQDQAAIIGVISWSTGPDNSAGCGGLTGVTPLALYLDWIVRTAKQWGAAL